MSLGSKKMDLEQLIFQFSWATILFCLFLLWNTWSVYSRLFFSLPSIHILAFENLKSQQCHIPLYWRKISHYLQVYLQTLPGFHTDCLEIFPHNIHLLAFAVSNKPSGFYFSWQMVTPAEFCPRPYFQAGHSAKGQYQSLEEKSTYTTSINSKSE